MRRNSRWNLWTRALLLVASSGLLLVGCSAEPSPSATEAQEAAPVEEFSLPASADEWIERSIAFHDPDGRWANGRFAIQQRATRPGGSDRVDRTLLDNGASRFWLETTRDGAQVVLDVRSDDAGNESVEVTVDGETPTPQRAAELRFDEAGALRMRNYYVYLFGLPMKLRDPGTLVDPLVQDVEVDGRSVKRVRVSYDPDVGSDVWYFDFDPETAEMVGYRFYHDEGADDGEWIELEGLVEIGGLRLPESRTWYRFAGEELLGTDTLSEWDGAVE